MIFGNIQGLVNGTEQIVFDSEVTGSAVTTISTGNILNGDEDGWYTVIFRLIGGNNGAYCTLRLNGDSGNNYGRRGISASNTTVSDASGTGDPGMYPGSVATAGHSAFNVMRLYAKSGFVRLSELITVDQINGTTVGRIIHAGTVWNNTADNLTSLSIVGNAANDLGVGTRLIILKSNNFTNGTPTGIITTPYIKGSWVRVGSTILGAAASSVTFSELDGDRDVIYRLAQMVKVTASANIIMQINGNSSTNYGYQVLSGVNTTVAASRNAYGQFYFAGGTPSANSFNYTDMLMFAKTGFVRPAISMHANNISGTMVTELLTQGLSYSQTSTNITSMVISPASGNFDTGSQFELYALRPNG